MKISITGGAGFVGQHLIKKLSETDHEIISIDLFAPDYKKLYKNKNISSIKADSTKKGEWQKYIEQSDIVINLTGATIFNFWSKKYKSIIYNSRILTTKNIVESIDKNKRIALINASAAGYYGNRGNDILTEQESPGNDFLASVCNDWENEALKAKEKNTRVAITRFGVVLGNGGALSKMIPLSKMMINPVLGNGNNFFPWIHIEDLCNAIIFLITNEKLDGVFNITSPDTITQKKFTSELYKKLNRPLFFRIPESIAEKIMGELGKSFMFSQKAIPANLLKNGFDFLFPDITTAFKYIIT